MTQLLHDHSDVHIRVFNCMPHESGGGRGLIRLRSDENMSAILDGIRSRKDVIKSRFNRVSERTVMGEVAIDKSAACTALKQSECFMISSKSASDGWLEWTVAAESNEPVYDLIDRLKKNTCEVNLSRVSTSIGASGLTQRQEDILQFAYRSGFYEYPRRIRLRDLSHIFDALNHISFLNLATRSLIFAAFSNSRFFAALCISASSSTI